MQTCLLHSCVCRKSIEWCALLCQFSARAVNTLPWHPYPHNHLCPFYFSLKVLVAKQQTTENEHTYPKLVTSVVHCVSVHSENWRLSEETYLCTSLSSAGLGKALVRYGWMMLAVLQLQVNHVFSHAETGGLDFITVPISKMWQFHVLVLLFFIPETAALLPLLLQIQSIQV